MVGDDRADRVALAVVGLLAEQHEIGLLARERLRQRVAGRRDVRARRARRRRGAASGRRRARPPCAARAPRSPGPSSPRRSRRPRSRRPRATASPPRSRACRTGSGCARRCGRSARSPGRSACAPPHPAPLSPARRSSPAISFGDRVGVGHTASGAAHRAAATAPRMKSIAASVGAPGVNTSATPSAFSSRCRRPGSCRRPSPRRRRALLAQQLDDPRHERHVRAGQDRQPDGVGVLLDTVSTICSGVWCRPV